MSVLQAQSPELDALIGSTPVINDKAARGLRVADTVDAPIASPVHMLQDQLQRLGEDAASVAQVMDDKAPGWIRLALPVALSVALWSVILRVTGLIG